MLTSIEKLALAKALTDSDFKAGIGVHIIDKTITLRIKGTVTKGKDVQYTPTVAIPLLATMAILLHRMGFQREAAKNLLIESMTEALNAEQQAAEYVTEHLANIEDAMSHVRDITDQLPLATKSGATKVKVDLTELELVEAG